VTRRKWAALVATTVAAALVLSGCGGGSSGGLKGAGEQAVGKNDINPVPRDQLAQGGTFTWGEDDLPSNYNYYQVDGLYVPNHNILGALMPRLFVAQPDNTVKMNPDYLTSAKVTSTKPEVITLKLNPKAKWSNGRPISWQDFQAMATALKGDKPEYQVSTTTGYEDIAKVEKGATDQEVKITFDRQFGEWKSLFTPLMPKELMSTAKEFNEGWVDKPKITAGPFKVGSVDNTAKIISLVPDPNWWGNKPKLDKLVFRTIDRNALADAFANKTIDYFDIGSSIDLYKRSESLNGAVVRQADVPKWNFIEFNGKKGDILRNVKLRLAIMKGLNPVAFSKSLLGQMVKTPRPLGNHIYSMGTPQYRDNSGDIKFDPAKAKQELDALGWKMNGDYRVKNGKQLNIRDVIDAENPISDRISRLTQAQLKQIGVKVTIDTVPAEDFFSEHIIPGNFDITGYAYENTSFPASGTKSIYYYDPKNVAQNYAQIGDEKLNKLYDQLNAELNDQKRVQIANAADKEIWQTGHQLPLYQYPGAVVVRNTVANFGAWGFQTDYPYENVGFKK
jgi:peptide/nickel transport system substrate-binding protein